MKTISQEVTNTIAEEIKAGHNAGEFTIADGDTIAWDLSITHLSDVPY